MTGPRYPSSIRIEGSCCVIRDVDGPIVLVSEVAYVCDPREARL